MSDWIARIAGRFHIAVSRLYVVADPDRLLESAELYDALLAKGFRLVAYEDPIEFRFLYEDEIRPRLREDSTVGEGVIIVTAEQSVGSIPFDILSDGHPDAISFADFVPRLDPVTLRDVPRAHLRRIVDAYERSESARRSLPLTDLETRSFLIRDVYQVPVATIATSADLVGYLISRHYGREELPEIVDRLVAEQLSPLAPKGLDMFELLHDRGAFFDWLQNEWRHFVRGLASAPNAGNERVPFAYPPIRVYVDNLFSEGILERVDVGDSEVPEWTKVGVHRRGDDPVRECRDLLQHVSGQVPDVRSGHQQWTDFAWSWALLRWQMGILERLPTALASDYAHLRTTVDDRFAEWLERRFGALTSLPASTQPVVVSHIGSVLRRRLNEGERVALIVVDGMAIEHWINVTRTSPDIADWKTEQNSCFAWVPTLTSISRQAIFAGRAPTLFRESWNTTAREQSHWTRQAADAGLSKDAAHYGRVRLQSWSEEDRVATRLPEALESRLRMLAVVINDIDELAHANLLGHLQMHQNVSLWSTSGRFQRLLGDLLELGFTLYITSDHGSVDAVGMGQPQEGVLVEQRAARARVYDEAVFAERVMRETPHARRWPPVGLPDDLHVLIAAGTTAFAPVQKRVVSHGGISLEEVIVPFVRVRG